jgi:anaerobic ribonucleoside-triphosphate reductase
MLSFNRISRVTGYLTGDVKIMNNSKQVEVSERVKHASVQS